MPYAAYLDLGDAQVISLSPEMFLRRDGDRLESRPMKGTRPRGATHAEDVALAYELAETEKERAENLMIVDMVRNDLGRVCRPGSVHVPALFAVEPYRTVWQMTSTVTGDVRPPGSLGEIMRAVFPGASITGAPKHHTMEIIAEWRPSPAASTRDRGPLLPGRRLHRQHRHPHHHPPGRALHARHGFRRRVGRRGGSRVRGDPAKADLRHPAGGRRPDTAAAPGAREPTCGRACVQPASQEDSRYLFETILLEARDWDATIESTAGMVGLSPSLGMSDDAILDRYATSTTICDRMAASAPALGFPFDRAARAPAAHRPGPPHPGSPRSCARATSTPTAAFILSTREAPAAGCERRPVGPHWSRPSAPTRTTAVCGTRPACAASTTASTGAPRTRAVFDALFLNRLDRVTEGAITNLFARFGDRWVTPPLADGLLPGIWRAWFLAETGAEERSLTLDELPTADEIVVGNSVRGGVSIDMIVADPVVF